MKDIKQLRMRLHRRRKRKDVYTKKVRSARKSHPAERKNVTAPTEVQIVHLSAEQWIHFLKLNPIPSRLEELLAESSVMEFVQSTVVNVPHAYVLVKALRRLHEKNWLAQWLRYAQFYHQAYFTFTKIGKPSQGVSPPEEQTLQAA